MGRTPGAATTRAELTGVALSPAGQGTQATVELRNTGNVMIKGKGTLEVRGSGSTTEQLPFALPTVLPTAALTLPVDLGHVQLQPGTYEIRAQLTGEDGAQLASWAGPVAFGTVKAAEAPRPVALQPSRPLVSETEVRPSGAVTERAAGGLTSATVAILAVALVLVLGAGIGLGLGLSRRGGKAQPGLAVTDGALVPKGS